MHTATHLNTDAAQLGAAMKVLRGTTGLGVSELARRVGANKSTVSRFERGEREISPDLQWRIAQALADELLAKSGRAA